MKLIYIIFILLFTYSCAKQKTVYWCGDHPCINKKEKEEYFKKNMSVEVKNVNELSKEEPSYIDKMKEKAILEQKKNIKEEKKLAKKLKEDEKRIIKEEKKLAKKLKEDEKRIIKEEKKLAKKLKSNNNQKDKVAVGKTEKRVEISSLLGNLELNISKFNDLVDKITKKNTLRPYPDINDIPN